MSTEKSGPGDHIETTGKMDNNIEKISGTACFGEKEELQNAQDLTSSDSETEVLVTDDNTSSIIPETNYDTEMKEYASLSSHHRTHHHHHHHHHRSDHRSDSEDEYEYDYETSSLDSAKEGSIEGESIKEVTESELVDGRTGIEEEVAQKRIPLAAHHRSHRHHRSGEHHHHHHSHRLSRGRHHRRRRLLVSKAEYYHASGNNTGEQMETIGIDEEEFARLYRENLEEMDAEKRDVSNKGTVGRAVFSHQEAENETADSKKHQEMQSKDIGKDNSVPRLGAAILAAREAKPRSTRKASSIKSSGSYRRQKKANARTIIIRILIGIAVFLACCVGVLLFMRVRGQSSMTPNSDDVEIIMPKEDIPDNADVEDSGKTVVYKGQKYRWNENITTFLILGTDRTLEQQENGKTAAGINGQADTILLAVIDNTNKKISFININRDTFVPVAEYTSDGNYAGEKKMQICLSYAYGKDNETSCRYTAEAVSKYLYGMPIDYYVRLSYDAIPVLTDSVGGVTLTVAEDLTSVDPSLIPGSTVTLAGSQALTYVRWRNMRIVETNENRISRQKQYLYSFMGRTIECTRADLLLPFGLYANVKPYMTTNVSLSQLTYITSKVLEYGVDVNGDAIHSIPGKSVVGSENHVEFYPDQTALYEQVLDTFYNKV